MKNIKKDKTRQDIYYHNIASTISWHTVSKKKTLVETCQISSITNQTLQIISKKQRKSQEEICVINSKARKTNLVNAICERSPGLGFSDFISRVIMVASG